MSTVDHITNYIKASTATLGWKWDGFMHLTPTRTGWTWELGLATND